MKVKTGLAALLLSAALIAAPGLTSNAYAHDGWNKSEHTAHCEHSHLSKDKIELLHATFKEFHEDNKEDILALRNLHRALHDVLKAPNFDKDTFLSLTKQIQEKRNQLELNRALAFTSIADKFTPEEREHLGRMHGHRRGHHHGQHHRHGGWRHAGWKKHGENHHGWHHHEGKKDGVTDKNQAPAQSESAPAPAQ